MLPMETPHECVHQFQHAIHNLLALPREVTSTTDLHAGKNVVRSTLPLKWLTRHQVRTELCSTTRLTPWLAVKTESLVCLPTVTRPRNQVKQLARTSVCEEEVYHLISSRADTIR